MTTSVDYSTTRLSSIEALATSQRALARGEASGTEAIERAATELEAAAATLANADALHAAYGDLAAMMRATALLIRWADAVRTAQPEAARYVTAARQLVRDLRRRVSPRALTPGTEAVATMFDAVQNVEDVERVVAALLCTPMPVPIGVRILVPQARARPRLIGATDGEREPGSRPHGERREHSFATPVAFLRFSALTGTISTAAGGTAAPGDEIIVQPDVLYDLDLEVRLSHWPTGADRIEFTPLHVEPPGTISVPTFSFERPPQATNTGQLPVVLHGTGRLRVHGAQDLLARPLQVSYVANIVVAAAPDDEAGAAQERGPDVRSALKGRVDVQGQRRIAIRSLDPRLTPITGFPDLDARLLDLRVEARRFGIPDYELASFLSLLAATARLAQQAVTDDLYPGLWVEDQFQRDVRDRLRAVPEIGAELDEHPHAAGGITDLSFRRTRMELKVDARAGLTVDDVVTHYGQQTAQYVVASGGRCGVLLCLDTAEKTASPGLVRNDIAFRPVAPVIGQGASVILGVVIVRGNLATPSTLSKKSTR